MAQEHHVASRVRVLDGGTLHPFRPDDVTFIEEQAVSNLERRITRIEQWIEQHGRPSRGPRHTGPLYYSDPIEFNTVLEKAVGDIVQDLEPPTVGNVIKRIEKNGGLKLAPNTLAARLHDHHVLQPGQTPAVYLKALASQIRRQRGHMLLAIALIVGLLLALADQTVFADHVVAATITRAWCHVTDLCAELMH